MPQSPTPRHILTILLPYLKVAGQYATQIQSQISAQPEKHEEPNFFATALSDADLSVQTLVEVALLAHFPTLNFWGEEYEKSYNTKYFPAIDLVDSDDLLVTLDPIDGTRFYLDGHPNFQIILSVLNQQGYQAAIALSPAKNEYFYALRDQGTFRGTLIASLDDCTPLEIPTSNSRILLGFAMQDWAEPLSDSFEVIRVAQDYSATDLIPNVNGILSGEIGAAILAKGNWIDGGAIAFLAQEAGCTVTDLKGEPLPPLDQCCDRKFSGIIIALNSELHQHILKTCSSLR